MQKPGADCSRRAFVLGALSAVPILATARDARPLFRAGLLSDTHVTDDPKSLVRVRQAMELFCREGVDLICHGGDLADVYSPKGWAGYRAAMDAAFGQRAPEAFYAFGGHDRNRYVRKPGEKNREEPVWREMRQILRARHGLCDICEFRGYKFVIIQEYSDEKQANDLIGQAVRESGEKPVFVLFHEPAFDTVCNSVAWGNLAMRDIMDRYPTVVHLSGHVHGSNRNERQIWQGGFTAVNLGCLQHWCGECGNAMPVRMPDDGVMTMDVFHDAIVFHRFSLTTGEECLPLEPWTVPLPFKQANAPFRPEVRRAHSSVPAWTKDSRVTAMWVEDKGFCGFRITVPAAHPVDGAYRYTASLFTAAGRRLTMTQRMGEFWKLPVSARTNQIAFAFADALFEPKCEYRIDVSSENFYGKRSEQLSAVVQAPDFGRRWETIWESADGMRDLAVNRFVWKKGAVRLVPDQRGFVRASDGPQAYPMLTVDFPKGILSEGDPAGTVYRLVFVLEDRHESNGSWRVEVQDCTGGSPTEFYLPNLPAQMLQTPGGSVGPVTYVEQVVKEKPGPLEMRLAFSYGAPTSQLRFGHVKLERKML